MADQERSDICIDFTISLCALKIETNTNKFVISKQTALKQGLHALKSYLKLSREYGFHTSPNSKVSASEDHGENCIKVRPPLVRLLLRHRP